MIGALRSEFRKYFTTNAWWLMLLATFVLAAGFSAIIGYFTIQLEEGGGMPGAPEAGTVDALSRARSVYGGAINFGYILSLVAGVLTMGSELRHKTITGTFLATPHRAVVMVAKVITQLVTGLMLGLAYVLGAIAGGMPVLAAHDVPTFPEPAQLIRTLALIALAVALWSLIGLGLGIMMPMIAAIISGVAFALLIENLLGFGLMSVSWGEKLAKFLPSWATLAMVQPSSTGAPYEMLTWWQGTLVLSAYGLVFALIGTLLTMRRDVS